MQSHNSKTDPERYRRSVEQLTEIFRGIPETVNEVSAWRCPYKNAQDRCTAGFGCRNSGPRRFAWRTASLRGQRQLGLPLGVETGGP